MSPMLAYNKSWSWDDLVFPVYGSPKFDGIRCIFDKKGKMLSRNLKQIPNAAIREKFEDLCRMFFDCEIVVGSPVAPDCYNITESKVMTRNGDADGVKLYVFDCISKGTFAERHLELSVLFLGGRYGSDTIHVPQRKLRNRAEVEKYEAAMVKLGYEGIMLRSPVADYKHGRAGLVKQELLKLKRFEDSEAKILDILPRMKNNNKQTRDALGRAKRSTHKANKVPMPEAGLFKCADLKTGVEFECSMGKFNRPMRKKIWRDRAKIKGKILKYRFQPAGVKDKPRFPRAIGFRQAIDL